MSGDPVGMAESTRPLRLLRCLASADPAGGGVIEAVVQSSRALMELGVSVEIASLDRAEDLAGFDLPLPVHANGSGRGGYGFSRSFASWLQRHSSAYDAMIIEGLWQYHGQAVRKNLRGKRLPYFVFPHGMLDPWFREAYPLKHIKKQLYWLLAERFVFRDAAAALFTCDEERRLAAGSFWPYRCREEVVSLGIAEPEGSADDHLRAFIEAFPTLKGKRVVLFLGRLHEKKGCDLLLRAFARSRQVLGSHDLHLVLAGPCADSQYLEVLQSLAAELFPGLGHTELPVSFPGMLRGDIKWGAYRHAEVFVLPSHQENFGIAVVEALACGVPVLISRKVNIWREIETDGAGLAEPDTLDGTSALLRRWIELGVERQHQMGAAAKKCFASRFERGSAARNLLQALQRSGVSRRSIPKSQFAS